MAASFLRQSKKIFIRLLLFIVVLLPLWMWLAWRLTHKRKLVIAIIDKTVLTTEGQEHISLSWVLNQERFTRDNTELYQHDRDYFGFFPLHNEKFRVKGLERFSDGQLQRLSDDADAAYLTDAYGIYSNEWYRHKNERERSGMVYGGMSGQDLYLLQQLKAKHKLIVAEFNCIGSPTGAAVRRGFEESFGIHWTGWVGRYFASLDTVRNKDLPQWLVHNYRKQHNGSWPFVKSGVVFVHADDRIVIAEQGTHLDHEFPHISFNEEGQRHYGLPAGIRYNYWFDVITVDTTRNHIMATFAIDANIKGRRELASNGLSTTFPAIAAHTGRDYRFFYFAGDFCDNSMGLATSCFKGAWHFSWLMYNRRDPQDRAGFFWKVYRPLVTRILNDYYTIRQQPVVP